MAGLEVVSVTTEEIAGLGNDALASRMSEILLRSSPRPELPAKFPVEPTLVDFFNSSFLQQKPHEVQRKALYKCFEFRLQNEYLNRVHGWANAILYRKEYSIEDWKYPRIQTLGASINQTTIVSSRIAFERFMDLTYFLHHEKELESKKSKFKPFARWLCQVDHPFVLFAPNILVVREFDAKLRTPEVHGGSKLAKQVLLMRQPDSSEVQRYLDLVNLLLNMWRPLVDILNGKPITSSQGVWIDAKHGEWAAIDWIKAYQSRDTAKVTELLELYGAT
jgi:hypothetical protein